MSVCEVYEMRADVEPQCIAADSEVRIYLSAVRSSREEINRRKKGMREGSYPRREEKEDFHPDEIPYSAILQMDPFTDGSDSFGA